MKISINTIVKVGILSALAAIIAVFEFMLPLLPPFLKLDFSEIPALLAAFSLGPASAVLIELIKNILHLFSTQTVGIGELANFLVGISYVIPVGIIYKLDKSRKGALTALTAGTASMIIFSSIFNYFILLPLYAKVLHFPTDAVVKMGTAIDKYIVDVKSLIALGIVPFNLIKGVVISTIVILIYKRLSPILHYKGHGRTAK
jgi:riboflavin transporter